MQRGYRDPEAARHFLWPELTDLHPPLAFRSMGSALERLHLARRRGESVGVFGDYDVDGVTSTALLVSVLREFGLDVHYRLPERLTEGYGVSKAGLEELLERGVTLLITVDCGITATEEIAWAHSRGVDTIVCDHHLPPPAVPPALAVLDPKLPLEGYPFSDLAGVGVALKLAQALTGKLDPAWLELAALGTVADVVPLQGENRVLVTYGLKALASSRSPGLKALMAQAGLDPERLRAGQVAFRLAPRLNASGRLGSAAPGVELLLTKDPGRAQELALLLESENNRRRSIEAEVLEQAVAQVEAEADLQHDMALVVAGENWHPGVLGIVAARLVERWARPALVITLEGEEAKGSGRSIPAFSLYEGLKRSSRWLKAFGGHHLAAGFALRRADVLAFRTAFLAVANSVLRPEDLVPSEMIDAEVQPADLTVDSVQELELLAPFGKGNPEPVLLLRSLSTERVRTVGQEQEHLRLELGQGKSCFTAVGFGQGERAGELNGTRVDAVFSAGVNDWEGKRSVELFLKAVLTPGDQVEVRCLPPLPEAPYVYDLRGRATVSSLAVQRNTADLVLTTPPPAVAVLANQVAALPPGAAVWFLFGTAQVEAAKQSIRNLYPDRDFLARLYLALKTGRSTPAELEQHLLAPADTIRQGLTVLEELALVRRRSAGGGEPLFTLQAPARDVRVDLRASRTFRTLELERRRSLAFLAFLHRAPGPLLATFCARLWQKAHEMTKGQLVC
ncbi:MAG TPA: single-stranded-DNA-specific exonuclease RecJ [Firmicutes bacterium]|nr:single-stranded-DNA-specific exonuclease RecJ [Bacillota bacterium]